MTDRESKTPTRAHPAASATVVDRRRVIAAGLGATGLGATGLGAAGLGAATAGLPTAARAAPPEQPWTEMPGEVARKYGSPSVHEAAVERHLITVWPDLAPSYSFSGTPIERLAGTITPNGLHYEIHHSGVPDIDPAAHRLMVHGRVARPLAFDADSLLRYPMVTRTHFLESAGNSFFAAGQPEPVQAPAGMLNGLVSNTEWTGVPVRLLLEEAGIEPDGTWAVAVGADAGGLARSVPVAKLLDDALVALFQNGERLRPEQGYPMRLLLPGWEGNMNVKWLTSLWLTDRSAGTRDEIAAYADVTASGEVLQNTFVLAVKSVITRPSFGFDLPGPGLYEITGLAWSGRGRVARVEVSTDGGATWAEAELAGTGPDGHGPDRALTRFRYPWRWDGGPATLLSRATDEHGDTQPTRAAWKAKYGPGQINHFNAVQAWSVDRKGVVRNVYA